MVLDNMPAFDLGNLILVKDKDGSMKYFDPDTGRIFSIEEIAIANQEKQNQSIAAENLVIKPVITFVPKEELKTVPAVDAAILKKETLAPAEKVDSKATHELKVAKGEVFQFETLEKNETSDLRRVRDTMAVDEKVNSAIAKLKMSFSDEKIKTQFVSILKTYFRGVRTLKEVEYVLELAKISGGLELPKEKVKLVSSVLSEYFEGVSKERRSAIVAPSEKLIPSQPLPATELPPASEKVLAEPSVQPAQKMMVKPVPINPKEIHAIIPNKKMEDIKAPRRLVGPLEELSLMSLSDFRRLGKDKNQIINYILEKIQYAAGASLPQKVLAIREWKKSPVFKLYLSMSFQAMSERSPMQTVIENRQHQDQETMTLSELEAINFLNIELGKVI